MRIYDIEFDIDSFIDEMEELQRARRQRHPAEQIHRPTDFDYRIALAETASERETD
jgi:hypothetical protein